MCVSVCAGTHTVFTCSLWEWKPAQLVVFLTAGAVTLMSNSQNHARFITVRWKTKRVREAQREDF